MTVFSDALTRLSTKYNGYSYDPSSNPGGMDNNGHQYNFIPALQDVATVGSNVSTLATYAQAAAAQVAAVQTGTFVKNMCPTLVANAGFGVCSYGTIESAISSFNQIANPGFEVDVSGWASGNSAILARDTSTSATGAASLKIINGVALYGCAYASFQVTAGRVYKVALYMKRGTSTAASVLIGTAGASSNILAYTSTSTSWTRQEVMFEATSTGAYYISLMGDNVSGSTANFDAISVYDMGPNLVTGGTFDSVITGWGVVNGAQSLAASNISGNCLKIANGSNSQAYSSQNFAVTSGKLYRVGVWLLAGTNAANLYATSTGGAIAYGSVFNSSGSWVYKTILLEAQTNSLTIQLLNGSSTTGATAYYDSVTVTEVTVGCTDINSAAFDGWSKEFSANCWRETIDTKGGSYYAARVYNGSMMWSPRASALAPDAYMQFAGRYVVLGCWVKSSVSGKAFLYLTDGVSTVNSAVHSGSGNWEWLECCMLCSSSPTAFGIALCSGAGNVANFSQPQFQCGLSIGQGNFVPQQNELIYLDTIIPSSAYNTHSKYSSSLTTIYRSADSQGKLPKFVKELIADVSTADTATGYYTATINGVIVPSVSYGWSHAQVGIKDVGNGAMTVIIAASGSSTFELLMQYMAVILY